MVSVLIGKRVVKLARLVLVLALVSVCAFTTSRELDPLQRLVHVRDANLFDTNGPCVDRAIFNVITGPDAQVQALIDDEVDHLADKVDAEYIDLLEADPNIDVTMTERLGFGFMAINCIQYPYNIPGLRRAIAFAMDKHAAADAMWGDLGFATDNPIPASCGAWHNSDTLPDFRNPNVEAAQQELARAGFIDRDGDGFVEAPNGDSFTFRPMVWVESPYWQRAVNASLDYWEEAGIRTTPIVCAAGTLLGIVYTIPRNYEAACSAFGVSPNPLSLQNFITSEVANPEGNMVNWGNSTYDDWVEVMMTSSNLTVVLEAAHQAQQVIVENAPIIPMYGYREIYAHRTDRFEDWIDIPGWGTGPENSWNPYKVKLKDGQPDRDPGTGCGGTYRTIISSAMDSQNPLTSTSVYGNFPLSQVYSRLTGLNDNSHLPTKRTVGLAYNWVVQPHTAGLKYTFNLYDNASWHDLGGSHGGLVTAHDVEFSYNYIKDNLIPTYRDVIPFLNSCLAIDHSTVEIVTNGQSYWAFDSIRDWVILPEHIWKGILSPVTFENPNPVGCGPFTWHNRVRGEYVELHYWENYHRAFLRRGDPPRRDTPISFVPIIALVGILVIIGTLVVSGIYLNTGRRNLGKTGRSVSKMEKSVKESSLRMSKAYCPNCRTRASEDDKFCSGCGQQIRE